MKKKSLLKPLMIVASATVLTGSLGFYVWKEEHRRPLLEIYVFAPSSGRSMFIRTPEDKRILVDGGSNSEIIRELTSVLPFYSRRIDVVIATNIEGKNVSGLIDVIERYKVGKAYVPAFTLEELHLASSTDQIYKIFVETLERENIPIEDLQQGRVIYLDSKVRLNINFPTEPKIFDYSKTSAPEVLFDISYDKSSIAFLGNATNKVQKYVASTTSLVNTDVLIVSHSALPVNTSKQLIEKIKPRNLVYLKRVTDKVVANSNNLANISNSSSSKKKKVVVDPLEYLDLTKRFNVQDIGTVKLVSDGERVIITNELSK